MSLSKSAEDRAMLMLHGDSDLRIDYQESVTFKTYKDSVETEVELTTFEGAGHTKGMLIETQHYRDELVGFFEEALDPVKPLHKLTSVIFQVKGHVQCSYGRGGQCPELSLNPTMNSSIISGGL